VTLAQDQQPIGDAIRDTVSKTSEQWAKRRRAERRSARQRQKRRDRLTNPVKISQKEAANRHMVEAYEKASGAHSELLQTPVAHARQIMYAARNQIQEESGKTLDDDYFTQQLLPDFMADHPDLTRDWNVVFDARGKLTEPHTNREVGLGTLEVRQYLDGADSPVDISLSTGFDRIGTQIPTIGPNARYNAILFVEKEGFLPLLRQTYLAERYDVAIMSTKGMSTTAARLLVDQLPDDLPIVIVRDFDKAGFSIASTLQNDTRPYKFSGQVNALDCGLLLDDVRAHDLPSEKVVYKKGTDPRGNLRANGATEDEIAFIAGKKRDDGRFVGSRVELNAFTSDELVKWIEEKLQAHGIGKVVPEHDTLETAYRRAARLEYINDQMAAIEEHAETYGATVSVPHDIAGLVQAELEHDPALPWDQAVARIQRRTDQ
jgi:hypothetical protein